MNPFTSEGIELSAIPTSSSGDCTHPLILQANFCYLFAMASVLGSVLVIAGLYFLLWGKSKEARSSAAKTVEENGEHQVQLQTV